MQCRKITAVRVAISHVAKHINRLCVWELAFVCAAWWHIRQPGGVRLLFISAVHMQQKLEYENGETRVIIIIIIIIIIIPLPLLLVCCKYHIA